MTMAAAKGKPGASKEPWERENPRAANDQDSKHLSATQKATAKRHAKAAGRPYPNLVDNMQAAKAGAGKSKKK